MHIFEQNYATLVSLARGAVTSCIALLSYLVFKSAVSSSFYDLM